MQDKLVIGTRGSKLALAQTRLVLEAMRQILPTVTIETKIITTTGDINTSPIPQTTIGKAWFTAEIEEELASGAIDIAVHSLKDVPPAVKEGTTVLPVLRRGDPRDVLIAADVRSFSELPRGARIGTDSARRKALLFALRSDLSVESIRGNVDTRLRKMHEEGYDAIVLAAAGLQRLDMLGLVNEFFPIETFTPAPGQGVLAVQIKSDNAELLTTLQAIQDPDTVVAVDAEFSFVKTLGGGCKSPVGAYALPQGDALRLYGMAVGSSGTLFDTETGPRSEAAHIGSTLGERLTKMIHE